MRPVADLLTASEAAVVAAVSLRDVNRVIDEHILPREFLRLESGRMLEAAGCALIAFYFKSAKQLTAEERLLLIAQVGEKLLATGLRTRWRKDDWIIRDAFLTIDLGPFLKTAGQRLALLAAARAAVTTSPDILGGTPVVIGTRVPVHDVAASLEGGKSPEDVLAAYPSLTREQLDLCTLYAEAYPRRGRPRTTAAPPDATVLADRSIARRKDELLPAADAKATDDNVAEERRALLRRLSAHVTSRVVLQDAQAAPLSELRAVVTCVEETAVDIARYGRLQSEAAPGNW